MANPKVTPKGTLVGFVNILKADFKYDEAGKFKFKLAIPKGKACEALCQEIEEARDEAAEKFKKDPKNKGKRLKTADLPFYEDEDTGDIVFSFSSKASYVDQKTQQVKQRVLPIFGAKGRIKPEECPNFGAGSEIKVAYQLNAFANAAIGAGVSLRIDSVLLIKPVEFSGGGSNPFGDEEGYEPEASSGSPFGEDLGDEVDDSEEF